MHKPSSFLLAAAIALMPAFAAMTAVPASAATPRAISLERDDPNLVEVAVRCGPRAHYVKGHRTRHGYVKGVCVRDRRR